MAEKARRDPLYLIDHLSIKTKSGSMERFVTNRAQIYILNIIRACIAKSKPIRLIILKARQLGCSTLIEAILYSITSQTPNTNALIVADDQDGANYLFGMSKLFQETCPSHLRPVEKRSNEKKLEFEGIHSEILIDTANHKEAGRKYTFRVVHLSEYAFFPYPNELMLGLSQAVPSLPGTMLIKESTANGFNHFKDEWDKAVNKETDYIPIFIPWYWDDGYTMDATGFIIGDPGAGEAAKSERYLEDLMKNEGINRINERLSWRRWAVRNNCNGSVVAFQQEYPSTPEEAFIASGECAFDKEALIRELKTNTKPLARFNVVKQDYKYIPRHADDGDFEIYEQILPRSREEYIVAGDACSGSGADYACLIVIGKRSNNTVAVYHGKCDADELAEKAALLGHLFHDAEIAIENDKYGFHANRKLKTIYGNLFMQETISTDTQAITQKFGWETNSRTRPDMLGQLKQEIREGSTALRCNRLIRECLTFVKNKDTGKEEAQDGCNDDMVMARAIASAVRQMHPFAPIRDDRPHRGTIIGDY